MEFYNYLYQLILSLGYQQYQIKEEYYFVKEQEKQIILLDIVKEQLPGQFPVDIKERQEKLKAAEENCMLRFGMRTSTLMLLVLNHMPDQAMKEQIKEYSNIWCIDRSDEHIIVYENSESEPYRRELYDGVESVFSQWNNISQKKQSVTQNITPINTIFVVANIIIFIVMSILGNTENADFMAGHGAMVYSNVIDSGEYYRFFTSMFLHFGVEHLLQNMLILFLIGSILEKRIGSLKYTIIYIGSGLLSSAASLFFTLSNEPWTVSAGASGAIFGVMGGLLFLILNDLVFLHKECVEGISLRQIIFMILLAASYGFFSTGVDNSAHIGGLIAGFFLTGICCVNYYFKKSKKI